MTWSIYAAHNLAILPSEPFINVSHCKTCRTGLCVPGYADHCPHSKDVFTDEVDCRFSFSLDVSGRFSNAHSGD